MIENKKTIYFVLVSLFASLISGIIIIFAHFYFQYSEGRYAVNHLVNLNKTIDVLNNNDKIRAEVICVKSDEICYLYDGYKNIIYSLPYSFVKEHKNNYYMLTKNDFVFLFPIFNMRFSYLFYILVIFTVDLLIYYSIQKIFEYKMVNKFSKKFAKDKSLVENKAIITLTENLHHELNSPVLVLKDIYEQLSEYSKNGQAELAKHILQSPEINKIIQNSFEQILNIIESMRDFKKLRLSNGDKNLYDLVEGAVLLVQRLIDHNFTAIIDEDLKKYKINHRKGLANGDLLNILVNMVKNSVEAAASEIRFKIESVDEKYLYLLISDNGAGIPAPLKCKIFKNNFSTKKKGLRGNGLYIAKILLNECGGDMELVYSEEGKGSTFRLKIPQEPGS